MTIFQPVELWNAVESAVAQIGVTEFVTRNSQKRLREKWCAARFGMAYDRNIGPCQVEIEDVDRGEPYDFHLLALEQRLLFQIAEVLAPGRHRHDEYRQLEMAEIEARNRSDTGDASRAASEVRDAIKRKALRYAADERKSMHLLLYLNLGADTVSWAGLSLAVEEDAKAFASVWALTHELVSCLYGGNTWHGKVGWKPIEAMSSKGNP